MIQDKKEYFRKYFIKYRELHRAKLNEASKLSMQKLRAKRLKDLLVNKRHKLGSSN